VVRPVSENTLFSSGVSHRDGLGGCTARGVAFGKAILVAFILCQALDGLLTYSGIRAYGPTIEGNPILATWMLLAGTGPTLLVAKIAACACGTILYVHGTHKTLAVLTAVYLVVSVAPWVYLLTVLV
jgi:hypothetical protein